MARFFDYKKVALAMKRLSWDEADLVRAMVKAAPPDIMPTRTYVMNVLGGQLTPGANYVALLADALGVSTEDLFTSR